MTDYVPDAPCAPGTNYGPGECVMETIPPQPAAPTVPELPSTGVDLFAPVGFGVVLVLAGLSAIVLYRRRLPRCKVPPLGWRCSRTPNHAGPCAARRWFQRAR